MHLLQLQTQKKSNSRAQRTIERTLCYSLTGDSFLSFSVHVPHAARTEATSQRGVRMLSINSFIRRDIKENYFLARAPWWCLWDDAAKDSLQNATVITSIIRPIITFLMFITVLILMINGMSSHTNTQPYIYSDVDMIMFLHKSFTFFNKKLISPVQSWLSLGQPAVVSNNCRDIL